MLPAYVLITRARNKARLFKLITERSPLAKAATGLLVVVGKTTRGFKSLPSPPIFSRLR